MNETRLSELAAQVLSHLQNEGAWLCVVESCTGGLLAHSLTEIPGASQVLWATMTAYENSAKIALAGVPETTIECFGAVSAETARALAQGGLLRMKQALSPARGVLAPPPLYCLATTGIAGPAGGSTEKPVGLCFIAVACSHADTAVVRIENSPSLSRTEQKRLFAEKAFQCLLNQPQATMLA